MKIHPAKPISQVPGATFTENDPLKFQNGGGHKMKAAKPDEDDSGGPLRPNKTLIPTMNADKPPKQSKVMGTKKWFDPHSEGKGLNATDGKTTPTAYPLKKSYEK